MTTKTFKKGDTISYKELMDQSTGTCYKLSNECPCGCGEIVKGTFAQGHDMKVKSQEIAAQNTK